MITVIHGDNTPLSRDHLNQLINQAKRLRTKEILRLDSKTLTKTDLIQATQASSLFGSDKIVVIERLFSLPKSTRRDLLLAYLNTISSDKTLPDIIVWEPKLLTSAQLKKAGKTNSKIFKIPKTLFTFVESLGPDNKSACQRLLAKTLSDNPPELVFAMLVRQLRLLIQTKSTTTQKLPPWQITKLNNQASRFDLASLLKTHQSLLDIDHKLKTGQNMLTLSQSLDMLITTL